MTARTNRPVQRGRRAGLLTVAALLGGLLMLPVTASAASFNFQDFSDLSGLQPNGSAAQVGTVLRLTDGNNEAGSVFTENRVFNPANDLNTRFKFSLHTGSTPPADGIAFVIHREGSGALGELGSGLGYTKNQGEGHRIAPSVAVEFDIYEVPENGSVNLVKNARQADPLTSEEPDFNLYGGDRWVWVVYSADTRRFKVFVNDANNKPNNPLLSERINLENVLDGRSRAGFSGGTGGLMAHQDILSWRFTN